MKKVNITTKYLYSNIFIFVKQDKRNTGIKKEDNVISKYFDLSKYNKKQGIKNNNPIPPNIKIGSSQGSAIP